jgi:hypothetical protein
LIRSLDTQHHMSSGQLRKYNWVLKTGNQFNIFPFAVQSGEPAVRHLHHLARDITKENSR